jgi:hypothetical protein
MKTARIIVLLLNFAIIGCLVYAGLRIYHKSLFGNNFFQEHKLVKIDNIDEIARSKPEKTGEDISAYASLSDLAKKRAPKVVDTTPTEAPKPSFLPIEVLAVAYGEFSGAHMMAGGVPRYFEADDPQNLGPTIPYRLVEIKEKSPGKEWTLFFEDKDGNRKQATYILKEK